MHFLRKYSLQFLFVPLLTLLLGVGLFTFGRVAYGEQMNEVRVGLFNNNPMCYVDTNGKPAGIFVSVIEYVAAREGWKLVYVHESFSALRTKLEEGEIDILLSAAVSEQRKKLYVYNDTDVFNNWAEVFIVPKSRINSLLDLKDKRVATLEQGIYSTGPEGIILLDEKFHLNCTILAVADYKTALKAVSDGQADAAVVNRLVGAVYAKEFGLVKSGIVFAPVEIRFALNKDNPATPARIKALDYHLNNLIADPNSIYNQTISDALGGRLITKERIPPIVWLGLFFGISLVVCLIIVTFLLRWQIKRKTSYLIEANNFNKQIFDSALEGIVVYDLDGRCQGWNPFMEQISGTTASEILGKYPHDVFPFLQGKLEFHDHLKKALQDEPLPPLDYFYDIPETGKRGWISSLKSPLKDSQGKVIGAISFIREISEQKRTYETMKTNEQVLRNLLDSTSTVPWELDLESEKFTYMGKQIESVLGYPVDSWQDMATWAERIHPQDKEDASRFCALETKKGNDHDFVYRAIHQDGSQRWIRDIVSVVMEDGRPVKLVGFMHNITEQKNLALEKENLEFRLQQAQKMEAIGTLAGGIAHDFNNILGAILGYAELAQEECVAGSLIAEDLAKVVESGYRAKDLVKQILAFSRQDATERIALQPATIVKEAIKMLRPSLPSTIEVEQHMDQKTGLILADPTQIQQILMNLCTNAFHAMEKTGGRLDISLKETELSSEDLVHEPDVAAGTFVLLSIADSGPGIEATVKERIFDPYFTTKETGKGTGMGLSIVHGIVKSYGGFISLYSEPGQGCIFYIYLPVVENDLLSDVKPEERTPMGNERILFIDDEELLAGMGKDMLTRLGYDVMVKTSSIEALQTFQNQPDQFDLVISDQTMPGMTGADLARRMLQIRPDLPIILCTGYSTIISEEQAKSIGIKEFALKPLAKKDLALLVRKVLDSA